MIRHGTNRSLWTGIGLAVFALGYLAVSYLPVSYPLRYVTQGVYFLAGLFTAAAVTGYALFRATRTNRFFWLAVFGGTVMFLVAEAYWVSYDMLAGGAAAPPHPSFTDIANIIGYIFLYIAVISMARFSRSNAVSKARYLTDTLIVILFTTIIYWALILQPMLADTNHKLVDTVFTSLYQLLDIGLLFGILANLFGFKVRNWRAWEGYVAGGVVLHSVADFGFAILQVNGTYNIGNLWANMTDITWLAGYFCFAVAGIIFMRKTEALSTDDAGAETLRAISKWQEVVVVAVIAIGLPFYVLLGLNATLVSERWVFSITGVVAIALAVLWGILVIQENNQLLSGTVIDPISGLFNAEFYRDRLEAELSRAKRFSETLCVVIIDINGLGQVNNVFGYTAGDQVLADLGGIIRKVVRLSDVACRVGGDEFGLILPESDKREALKLCHLIQADLVDKRGPGEPDVTLAWGIAGFPQDATDSVGLMKTADNAVYWHKFYDNTQVCMIDEQAPPAMFDEVDRKNEEKAYLKAIMAMAAAVDARDPFTRFHSKNVARYARLLAEEMGLPDERVKLVETAALVHDVGKIGIPDKILRKPEPLSAEDRVWVREHPALGQRMLAASTVPDILPWIAAHHEHWDGDGYPAGLKGEQIPLEAAILSVCDAYEAMTSERSYRPAMTQERALLEIEINASVMYHPVVAQMFVGMIKTQAVSDPSTKA